jgi:hypothetical protein
VTIKVGEIRQGRGTEFLYVVLGEDCDMLKIIWLDNMHIDLLTQEDINLDKMIDSPSS